MSLLSIAMNIFYKFHFFYGIDFGFFNIGSGIRRCILKLLSFILTLVICILVYINMDNDLHWMVSLWYRFYLFQYLILVLCFSFWRSDLTFFRFQCATKIIDFKLKSDTYPMLERKAMWSFLFIYLHHLWMSAIYSVYHNNACLKPYWLSFYYFLIVCFIDTVTVTFTLIFCSIKYHLVILISRLRDTDIDYTYVQIIYKYIVDVAEVFKSAYDYAFSATLVCTVPKIMFSIYVVVWDMKETNQHPAWLSFRPENIGLLIDLVVTLSPAVAAGILSKHTDKLRVDLHNKLLKEKDDLKSYEIERLIGYVEARPLKLTIFHGVIPLNVNLLGIVFNFCVTYLIVIIQFTHLD